MTSHPARGYNGSISGAEHRSHHGVGRVKSKSTQTGPRHQDPRAVYEIRIEGELDRSWEQWFSGLTISLESDSGQMAAAAGSTELPGDPAGPSCTTLTGAVADQAALRGLLCRLWDLNLTVVSVRRVEGEECRG